MGYWCGRIEKGSEEDNPGWMDKGLMVPEHLNFEVSLEDR